MIEQVKLSLNSNQYLSEEIKDNLLELAIIFNKQFPEVDLNNFSERLKTIKIIRGSKFLINGCSRYNPTANEVLISLTNITGDVDCKHILMREILNIITAKDKYTGFNTDNSLIALNVGYTEILVNFLVGNEYDSEYNDEIIATNLVAEIVGEENMRKAYFNNDASFILNQVQ